jgi:hypothetical protein
MTSILKNTMSKSDNLKQRPVSKLPSQKLLIMVLWGDQEGEGFQWRTQFSLLMMTRMMMKMMNHLVPKPISKEVTVTAAKMEKQIWTMQLMKVSTRASSNTYKETECSLKKRTKRERKSDTKISLKYL